MAQMGFYFDQTACIGCKTCQIACRDKNALYKTGEIFRTVDTVEVGQYPSVRYYSVSVSCNHCAMPACVANCPSGAMYKDEETGVVLHDDDMCIGCETCVSACPYSEPVYMEDEGIVSKCDSCYALRAKGESPACVAACPMRALDFGDLEELKAKYGNDLVSDVNGLPDSSQTTPSLLISPRDIAVQ
ncbi:4Fe-4S dicluster domain-containing protein [Raoultibacter phocaeensis]|uniref:4Fe-4S dicluster domain-containing protein n=1 Tax=Raoultibacter phocaeensis TaxID=2479841 RepID=UPI00111B3F0F|nr:4Fe-4S dicluster domain-containing protein [Raoultibacter phocaeensis]